MADAKISELIDYATPLDADLFAVVDTLNGITKKTTWANLKTTLTGNFVPYTGATANVNIGTYNLTINGTTLHTTSSIFTIQRSSDATDLFQVALASGNVTQLYGTFYAPILKSTGGSTSAPGLTFNGDTNTGFYGNGSGAWGLTNDGTTSIYGNASANIHIGGTSPLSGYKLTLTGNQYIDGRLDAEQIGYNSIRSLFGERGIFINEFVDVLWRANRRFTFTSSYGGSSPGNMFDGNFESTYAIPISTTDVMNINFANQSGVPASGITYPEGKLYVHFYYTNHAYSAISARVQMNVGWVALATPVDISTDSTNKVLEFTVPNSGNYLTDIELTVTTDGTNVVWITGWNYVLSRWTSETEPPYVDKHQSTNRLNGDLYFLDTTGATTAYLSNTAGNSYFTGKLAIGGTSPGTYHLNVTGNILGNEVVTNSGYVFKSLGVMYLRSTSTNPIHIGDVDAQPIDLGKGGGAVAINTDYSNIPSGTKLQVNSASGTTSAIILKLYGSATGFSGANDAGTTYSMTVDACSYQTSIKQSVGFKLEMEKANTWNYADTPTGIKSIINFYASAGTPDSPTLVKFLSGYHDNTVRLPSLDTDSTAPTTSGTTKIVITDANGQLSFTGTLSNTRINKRVVTTTDDATAVIDVDITDDYELTAIANNTTFTVTGTPTDGQTLFIRLKDAGVSKTLTWTMSGGVIGVTLPTATTAGKWHIIGFKYFTSTTSWKAIAVGVEA